MTISKNIRKPAEHWICYPFGKLVIEDIESRKCPGGSKTWAYCRCQCGNVKWILISNVLKGAVLSCGCYNKEAIKARSSKPNRKTASGEKTKEYCSWVDMKTRCTNQNNMYYSSYGGRGITVCKEWLYSFDQFLKDMGQMPGKGYSIERKDVNGNYEPSNCVWIPLKHQAKNKRNTVRITYNDNTKILSDWAKFYGVHPSTITKYIKIYGNDDGMMMVSKLNSG